jgi:hypothetical protein
MSPELDLADKEVANNLPPSDPGRVVKRRQVQRARQTVRKPKRQHGRYPA